MYVLGVMTEEHFKHLRTAGSKERNLAVYWSAMDMPDGVTRLYVITPKDDKTRGYFPVHEQVRNTLALWSEDFVVEETYAADFVHIVGDEWTSEIAKKKAAILKEKKAESEAVEPRVRSRKARKGRDTTRREPERKAGRGGESGVPATPVQE